MRKLLILGIILLSFSAKSQEKWRELTLGATNGVNLNGQMFTQASANLIYELKNKYSITNWTGANYNYSTKQSWFSSQTTVDKRLKQFIIGSGFQYGLGQFTQPIILSKNDLFLIVKIQYKIKL